MWRLGHLSEKKDNGAVCFKSIKILTKDTDILLNGVFLHSILIIYSQGHSGKKNFNSCS